MDRETIIIDNINRVIKLNEFSNYVIDSISIRGNQDTILSIALNDKSKGETKLFYNNDNDDYKIYVNKLNEFKTLENDLELLLILRKKGSNVIVNDKIANNILKNNDIQVLRGYKFNLENDKIDTLETDVHFR